MAQVNLTELRSLPLRDLLKTLFDLQKKYVNLRFSHKVGKLKNTAELGLVRRSIARVYTVLNERKLFPDVPDKSDQDSSKQQITEEI